MAEEFVIETEGLTKSYSWWFSRRKVLALDNLNIRVPAGAVFGFLGPNGAGKTTTLKLLMDLIKPTAGSAKILGMPSWDVDVKKQIGFLPDSPCFSGQMSAYEFLLICAKLLQIPSGDRKKRVDEVLETVQMTSKAKGKLASFSRGMLQRIGIAQAVLNNPRLLILDEPLLGLDPYGRQDLKNIIKAQNEKGTTVFFSSHILSDVQEICDRVAILNKGHLLCSGTIASLLSSEGVQVNVKQSDDIFKDLMTDARECAKKEDGSWELIFEKVTPELNEKLKRFKTASPEKVEYEELKGSLEDFFFKTIENDNKRAE